MTDISRYPFEVSWSDEDGGYIALAPDLAGCSAFGDTRAEALLEIEVAAKAWVEAAENAGNPIPPPRPRAEPSSHSGKFALRMPTSLHAIAARRAEDERSSLNQWIVMAISRYVGAQETLGPYERPFKTAITPNPCPYADPVLLSATRNESIIGYFLLDPSASQQSCGAGWYSWGSNIARFAQSPGVGASLPKGDSEVADWSVSTRSAVVSLIQHHV